MLHPRGRLLIPLLCALCAIAFGLFLGPWPIRIVGAAAGLTVALVMATAPTPQERADEVVEDFHTGEGVDLRVDLSPDPLDQNADGQTYTLPDFPSLASAALD